MVRARRVRAVVACTQNDECCSPNPKRKDQGKITHMSQTITQFFTPVKTTEHQAGNLLSTLTDVNDLDDDEKEKFKELPDILPEVKDDKLLPATPHRIELREDKEDVKTMLLKELQEEVLLGDDAQLIKEEVVALKENDNEDVKINLEVLEALEETKTSNTATKAGRRLNNNQTANQQAQPLKAKCVAKNQNAENNKANNHRLTDFFPVRRSERKTKKTVLEEKQRTLEDNLRRGVEKGLMVYNFEGKGRGIVAMRVFNRGDFVVEYAGDLIDMQEARCRELKYAQDQNAGCYMYYFKHRNAQYCIDATAETGRLGRLVNHSRNGNLSTRVIDVDLIPRLVLVAKDTIEIGEEVTYDYGDRSKESLKHHPWLAY